GAETIQRIAAAARGGSCPAAAIVAATTHILDTVGVAIAGARTDHAAAVRRVAHAVGGRGRATVIAGTRTTDPVSAACANAVAAHSIDLDDGHLWIHPGAAVVPAAFACAETEGASGASFIGAVVGGYAVAVWLSQLAGRAHRERGYHPTGTCNAVAAAVAAGLALALPDAQIVDAAHLACTQAAGLAQYRADGAPTKHLHAGLAARNGVHAALLAREGLRGARDSVDGRFGFLATLGGEGVQQRVDLADRPWLALLECYIKPYPACRQAHGAIDAALAIRGTAPVDPERVAAVEVETYEYAFQDWLVTTEPRDSALAAQLNIPFCVASALLDNAVTLESFATPARERQTVRALARRVRVSANAAFTSHHPAMMESRVTVRFQDGTVRSAQVRWPSGSPQNPIAPDALTAKFLGLLGGDADQPHARRFIGMVRRLDRAAGVTAVGRWLRRWTSPGSAARPAGRIADPVRAGAARGAS
ncbi:MAG TPA: MmgE/PrpD family protein, partial [bacterium]|nr:MmgE/PrpD family protein [bacterium]